MFKISCEVVSESLLIFHSKPHSGKVAEESKMTEQEPEGNEDQAQV